MYKTRREADALRLYYLDFKINIRTEHNHNTTMKQKKRINGKMHCGSCIHFINEGFYGDGWCDKYDVSRRCGNECLAKENKGNTRKISSK